MIHYYLIYADVYVNGEILHKNKYNGLALREDKDIAPYTRTINWDNIHDLTFDDICIAGIGIRNRKKGTKVEFWREGSKKVPRPLKEWKGDKLEITINYHFEDREAALPVLMWKWPFTI